MPIEKKCCLASLPKTVRGQPIVLNVSKDQKTLLYQNGNSVFLRDLEDLSNCDTYTQHAKEVTVAKYAPSGFYIASGDVSGKVRIWDTVNAEHILKYEYQCLSGAVKDIDWTEDSKRLIVVGDGREKYAVAIMWDTGTSVGDLRGPTKAVNSVAIRPVRPYCAAVASEDYSVTFYKGPPYKKESTFREHTNFVNVVRYAPDGSYFVSGGADCKMFVFDGKTGEVVGQFCEAAGKAHQAGVYGLAFSPDSKQVLSASADKTCRVWDPTNRDKELCCFTMGKTLMDMQVGCAWAGERMLSVSLSGYINYLDMNCPSQPTRIIKGHNKNVMSMALLPGGSRVVTGSFDAVVCAWDPRTGSSEIIEGTGHKNQIQDMVLQDDNLISIAWDDTIMSTKLGDMKYGSDRLGLDSQPRGLAVGKNGLQIVACQKEVVVLRNLKKLYSEKISYEAECVGIHPNQSCVAVGGQDSRVHIYNLAGDTLDEERSLGFSGSVTSVRFSPDGAHLAVTDANKRLSIYTYPDYKEVVSEMWVRHTARITSVDWSPDSSRLATGSLDTNLVVYTMGSNTIIDFKAAHPMAAVTKVAWMDGNTIASVGHDCCLRFWTVA